MPANPGHRCSDRGQRSSPCDCQGKDRLSSSSRGQAVGGGAIADHQTPKALNLSDGANY